MRYRLRTLMGLAAMAAIFSQAAMMVYERWTTKPLIESIAEFNTRIGSPYIRDFPLTEAEVIAALERHRSQNDDDALSDRNRREILRTYRLPASAKFSLFEHGVSPDGKVCLLNLVSLQVTLGDDTVRQLTVRKNDPRIVGITRPRTQR